ncbi:MAG: murein biosynthesis integral membrane protein MurJ [Proteobacteria bacterium]|nr:murein biosynthesis integral membrane protein MurJ [Pseudomonadota bacterium]
MIYTVFTMISRFLGFARDLVLAYYLGASTFIAADAYNMAFSFPNLFRRVFAEGAFAAAFVPAYSKSLASDGEEIADRLAADAMAVLAVATLAITIVAELSMPWLMYVIAPGFEGPKHDLAVRLAQIMMPYLPCMAIYAHLSGVLNGRNRFILSAAAPILLNLWTLFAVWPAHSPKTAAFYASWGVIAAGISQAALLWWGVRKSGAEVNFVRPRLSPEIKALIKLAVPGTIAASAVQLNIFISSILVSGVQGGRSWLSVCDRLYLLPVVVGTAMGVALLPRLSRAIHGGNHREGQAAIDEAVLFSSAIGFPAAAALVAMPYFLVDGLYTRGAFTHYDAQQTALALLNYGWGVPAFVVNQLTTRVFFANQDTRTPMRYALIQIAVNIAAGLALFRVFGVPGIAAATSLASWLGVILMIAALMRRNLWRPSALATSRLLRMAVASLALGVLAWLASHFRAQIEAPLHGLHVMGLGAKEFAVVGSAAVIAALYPFLLLASGGLTLAQMRMLLRRRKA